MIWIKPGAAARITRALHPRWRGGDRDAVTMLGMAETENPAFAYWRARMVHALRVSLQAMDTGKPAAEIARLGLVIRALERQGRARGFVLEDEAHE